MVDGRLSFAPGGLKSGKSMLETLILNECPARKTQWSPKSRNPTLRTSPGKRPVTLTTPTVTSVSVPSGATSNVLTITSTSEDVVLLRNKENSLEPIISVAVSHGANVYCSRFG